jgi:hypothetical protein
MKDPARENLAKLLRQFMDESAARDAQADVDAAERILENHPAPRPSPETVATLKGLMIASAARRRRVRIFRRTVAVAAAVVLTVLVGRYNRPAAVSRPGVNFASIIPAAVWDSKDLAADDLDLAYFASEIRRIESQIHAVEAHETEIRPAGSADDLELELIAIETEFVKGW